MKKLIFFLFVFCIFLRAEVVLEKITLGGVNVHEMLQIKENLFLSVTKHPGYKALWRSNGEIIKEGIFVRNMLYVKGKLVFIGSNREEGLWQSDGTSSGTQMLISFDYIHDIHVDKNDIFYLNASRNGKSGLWKYRLDTDEITYLTGQNGGITKIVAVTDKWVIFSTERLLFKTNGIKTSYLPDLWLLGESILVKNDCVYVHGRNNSNGIEGILKLDTNLETMSLFLKEYSVGIKFLGFWEEDIVLHSEAKQGVIRVSQNGQYSLLVEGYPDNALSVGNAWYFNIHGENVWYSDGTPQGKKLLADGHRNILNLVPYKNGVLFFSENGFFRIKANGESVENLDPEFTTINQPVYFREKLYFIKSRDLWRVQIKE